MKRGGLIVTPHILIPTLASGHEIESVAPVILTAYNLVRKEFSALYPELDCTIDYRVGGKCYHKQYIIIIIIINNYYNKYNDY